MIPQEILPKDFHEIFYKFLQEYLGKFLQGFLKESAKRISPKNVLVIHLEIFSQNPFEISTRDSSRNFMKSFLEDLSWITLEISSAFYLGLLQKFLFDIYLEISSMTPLKIF